MDTEPADGLARLRRLRTGLGTFLAVEAAAPSPEQVAPAIEDAFAAMREVEQWMHPGREGSDLARLNAAAGHSSAAVTVHRCTWELLGLAKQLNELSDGAFDPCLPCRCGRLADVELLADLEVRCHAPVKLDFGGVAKGYAIDRAVEALMRHGCSAGLVNAGGDLRVFGPRVETVLVRQSEGRFHPVRLYNAAIAVSDPRESRRPPEHAGYYSRTQTVFDPDAVDRSVAVVASEAALADALTKCAMLCTTQTLERLIHDLSNSRPRGSAATAISTATAPAGIQVHYPARFGNTPGMRPR